MISAIARPVKRMKIRPKSVGLSTPTEHDLVQTFKLLSDETRLRILLYLACEHEINVSTLCQRLGQSQPAVSHHLSLLREAGLIQARRDGKHNFYSVRQSYVHRVLKAIFEVTGAADKKELRVGDFVLKSLS